MKAGRELDALVAEKVIGYGPSYVAMDTFPNYSTDIAAAWKVVEQMAAEDKHLSLSAPGSYSDEGLGPARAWSACFGWPTEDWHESECAFDCDSAPQAICLAALEAKGIDV